MTKKVLIVTYFFNQKELIGSLRLRGLAKYLPEFGWEPTILTIKSDNTELSNENSDLRVIETDYIDLSTVWKSRLGFNSKVEVHNQLNVSSKKNQKGALNFLINMWMEIFAYPDPEKNWYNTAVKDGNELLENEKFDLILSSSYPYTSHLIGYELKGKHNLPWVVDLRDLWTQNHNYKFTNIRKFRESHLEKKVLSGADALTTVSEPWSSKLKLRHKNKKIYTIFNGFDPDLMSNETELDNKFTIIYTGMIYEGKMDPEPLFMALKELINDREIDEKDISVDFYGFNVDILRNCVEKHKLTQIINIHNLIPHDKVIEKQRKAQLLLLLNWNDPNENGVYTGKIFEYLSAKRPIIAIGGYGGVIDELFDQTNAGVSLTDLNKIKNVIKGYYSEFKSNGEVKYQGIQDEIDMYSYYEMTKKFSKVFDEITK